MNPETYGDKYPDHLLEQYKLYVEMADRVSQRRDQSNRFYVTIVSALAAIVIVIARFGVPADAANDALSHIGFLAIGLFGLALSTIWFFNIRSYRALNTAKFKIIKKIEKQLPFAGYAEEWDILNSPSDNSPRYLQLTRVEQFVPIIFATLFALLAIYAIFLLIA